MKSRGEYQHFCIVIIISNQDRVYVVTIKRTRFLYLYFIFFLCFRYLHTRFCENFNCLLNKYRSAIQEMQLTDRQTGGRSAEA